MVQGVLTGSPKSFACTILTSWTTQAQRMRARVLFCIRLKMIRGWAMGSQHVAKCLLFYSMMASPRYLSAIHLSFVLGDGHYMAPCLRKRCECRASVVCLPSSLIMSYDDLIGSLRYAVSHRVPGPKTTRDVLYLPGWQAQPAGTKLKHAIWFGVLGRFSKYGYPNISPYILSSLLWGPPKRYPLVLETPHRQLIQGRRFGSFLR